MGAGITIPGEKVDVVDLDGDAAPDLIARGLAQISIYHNDGSGQFTLQAQRDAPIFENTLDWLPQVRSAPNPTHVLAEFSAAGVNLLQLDGAALSPMVVANVALPLDLTLVGSGVRPSDGAPAAIMVDQRNARLVAYAIVASSTAAATELTSVPFAGHCALGSFNTGSFATAATTTVTRSSSLFVISDANVTCVARFDATGTLVLQALTPPALASSLLLDIDGDGLTDVLAPPPDLTSAPAVWLQTENGFTPQVALQPFGLTLTKGNVAAADFDGDGRDDLVFAGQVYLNRTQGSGAGFSAAAGFVAQPAPDTISPSTSKYVAGDLNGDHHADFVAWGAATSFMTCLGDGSGQQFTCAPAAVPFDSLDQMLIGDVNGDSLNDLVLAQTTGPGAITVFLGKDLSFPEPVGAVQPVAQSGAPVALHELALAHQSGHIASQLVVNVVGATSGGLAVGKGDALGVLEFAQSVTPVDVAVDHYTGASALDLAALTYEADGYHVHLFTGGAALAVYDFALGITTQWRTNSLGQFFRLAPNELALASGPTDDGSFVAAWDGSRFAVTMIPASPLGGMPAVGAHVDVDGDGRDEIIEMMSTLEPPPAAMTTSCAPRVIASSGGAYHASESLLYYNCNTFAFAVVPPFAGRLGLYTFNWTTPGMPDLRGYVQRDPFSFVQLPDAAWPLHDASQNPVTTTFSSHATKDFNGDGLPDFLMLTQDGVAHVAFADVKRR
jgi:hypothetical protein